jgi:hypothetical protein
LIGWIVFVCVVAFVGLVGCFFWADITKWHEQAAARDPGRRR